MARALPVAAVAGSLVWLRFQRRWLPSAVMLDSRRTSMAFVLLLALVAQLAWAIAHAAIHDHLAHHPHHQGEANGHHHHGLAHGHGHAGELQGDGAPAVDGAGHRHDHDHLDATFVLTTGSDERLPIAAIAVAEARWVPPPLHRRIICEGQPSRASPDPPDASRPRAPPPA